MAPEEVFFFGALRSEAEKAKLLEGAEPLFSPRVVNLAAVRIDSSLLETGGGKSLLPAKLPAGAIAVAVAGETVKTYPATALDCELASAHQSAGLLQQDVGTGLRLYRDAMARAGKLPKEPSYLLVANDGYEVAVHGEVANEVSRAAAVAAVQALAGDLPVKSAVLVTARVAADATLQAALARAKPLDAALPAVFSLQAGSPVRLDVVHSVPASSDGRIPIAHERLIRELDRVRRLFPKATFEFTGHTDNVGSETANVEVSLKRAQAVHDYVQSILHLEPSRVTLRGAGPLEPIADNGSETGRARNRRVDVTIKSYE